MVPPVRERRPPVGRVACRLGTPTSGRHSGPQGRGGEDPNRRDGSRLGTYPQQMGRRGQVRDRRPPVGSARGRRARGAVLLSAMAQIGPRITAQIRGVQDCAIRATGDSPLAALTGRVPTGGRRSKPSPRFLSVGGTPFRSPPASGADRRSAFPCLRVAPSGGLGAMRHVQRPRGAFCDSASAPEVETGLAGSPPATRLECPRERSRRAVASPPVFGASVLCAS